jgi:hypothetical protein
MTVPTAEESIDQFRDHTRSSTAKRPLPFTWKLPMGACQPRSTFISLDSILYEKGASPVNSDKSSANVTVAAEESACGIKV